MFDKSTEPGNDVMLAQFLFLFFAHSIFLRNFNGNGHDNCRCYCKKQINKIPCSVLLSTIKMTSNCSNILQWNYLPVACVSTWVLNIFMPVILGSPVLANLSFGMDTKLAVEALVEHMLVPVEFGFASVDCHCSWALSLCWVLLGFWRLNCIWLYLAWNSNWFWLLELAHLLKQGC